MSGVSGGPKELGTYYLRARRPELDPAQVGLPYPAGADMTSWWRRLQ
ncbi:hypothetical protein [Streptomyces griseoluteus]